LDSDYHAKLPHAMNSKLLLRKTSTRYPLDIRCRYVQATQFFPREHTDDTSLDCHHGIMPSQHMPH
jgi:hypothetical protein